MDEITLTGTVTHRGTRAPLSGVLVSLTPIAQPVTRMSDGSIGIRSRETRTGPDGTLAATLGHAGGLRWMVRVHHERTAAIVGVLDCDSWPAGSVVDVDQLPPVETLPPSAHDVLRSWLLERLAQIEVGEVDLSGIQSQIDTLAETLEGTPTIEAVNSAISTAIGDLSIPTAPGHIGAQPAGDYATTAAVTALAAAVEALPSPPAVTDNGDGSLTISIPEGGE